MIIKLKPSDKEVAEAFANARLEGSANLYRFRGEQNIDKIKEDIVVGALAEIAIAKQLQSRGVEVNEPDFKIYETKQKSFSADLSDGYYMFHCKAQSLKSAKTYGTSFMFQKTDKLLTNPSPRDYLVMAVVDDLKVEIKAVVLVQDIIKYDLLGEPKVPRYRHSKHTIYFNDLCSSSIDTTHFID